MGNLIPVILCGGAGTRLWPVSREVHPKPFIQLRGGSSLLQQTLQRATQLPGVTAVLTLTQEEIYFKTRDDYAGVKEAGAVELDYVLEPCPRNTAPAVAAAALTIRERHGPDATMLVMPADHIIDANADFTVAVMAAAARAQRGDLVALGVRPTHPETGYGYIQLGKRCDGSNTPPRRASSAARSLLYHAKSFVEKPDADSAASYVRSKRYLWNTGIFCFTAETYLEALKNYAPNVYKAVEECWNRTTKQQPLKLDAESFSSVPEISIDYAVMEHATNVAVVACDFYWSDIGTWRAVSELTAPDAHGNRLDGKAVLVDVENCYIQCPSRLTAAVGVSDLLIIDTPDALLIAHRDRAQDVKQVVRQLKSMAHQTYHAHTTVSRPWGAYTVLDEAREFKVKRIVVKPGAALSLQMHHHRSEQWVVVGGTAQVVNGSAERLYHRNDTIHVPVGTPHRIVNPGVIDLVIIEIQSGEYLGEDDIVRLDDQYGRVRPLRSVRSEPLADHSSNEAKIEAGT